MVLGHSCSIISLLTCSTNIGPAYSWSNSGGGIGNGDNVSAIAGVARQTASTAVMILVTAARAPWASQDISDRSARAGCVHRLSQKYSAVVIFVTAWVARLG